MTLIYIDRQMMVQQEKWKTSVVDQFFAVLKALSKIGFSTNSLAEGLLTGSGSIMAWINIKTSDKFTKSNILAQQKKNTQHHENFAIVKFRTMLLTTWYKKSRTCHEVEYQKVYKTWVVNRYSNPWCFRKFCANHKF